MCVLYDNCVRILLLLCEYGVNIVEGWGGGGGARVILFADMLYCVTSV